MSSIKENGLARFFTTPSFAMIAPIISLLAVALSGVQAVAPTIGVELNCTVFGDTDVSLYLSSKKKCVIKSFLLSLFQFIYTPEATNCVNTYSDKTCDTIYIATPAVQPVPGASTARPLKCYAAAATDPVNPDLVNAAVSTCPKTCGFCCQSSDYNCPNVRCKLLIQKLRRFLILLYSPTSQL